MRKLIIILFFIISHSIFAQDDYFESFHHTNSIGFACSFSGSSTKIVSEIYNLIYNKNYYEIINRLDSKKDAEKLISAFVLLKLKNYKKINLTKTSLEKIDIIKKSNELIFVCSGCTLFTKMKISDFFENKEKMLDLANNWIKRII